MPCLYCQEPSVGLANKPNQYAWAMACGWLPKQSLKDTLNQEGLVALIPFHLHQHHSIIIIKTHLCEQQTSQVLQNDGRCPGLTTNQYTRSKVRCHSEAEIKAGGNESYGWHHPGCLCSHQIMDLKVTEVQHRLPHQWHQCLRDQEVLGIHTMANGPTGNLEDIQR